ncbi:MAG: translocation/assembly module TamB domain-containing protein [Deltaproteobacteria bacterium]|nr:translocation/assembly module TamB domain-containing protein [Deltaproteobacteria bacterium]
MRRVLLISLALIVLLALAGWGVFQSQAFWRWGGWGLVNAAQDRLNADLKVAKVEGHPLTGFTFTDVTITSSQGEVLHTGKVELRFSLWSILRLHPVIANLTLHQPNLYLRQDQAGSWEVAKLLKKRPPPPFKSLDFPKILIEHGQVTLIRPGGIQPYQDLNLNLNLSVLHPKRPDQEVRIRHALLVATTPQGRFGFRTSLSYARDQLTIDSLDITHGDQALAALSGACRLGPEPKALFSVNLGPIPGKVMNLLWPKCPRDWEMKGQFRLGLMGRNRFEITGAGSVQQASFDLHGTISRETGQWTYDLQAKLDGLRPELLEPFKPQWSQKLKDLTPVAGKLTLKGAGVSWPPEKLDWSLETAACRNRAVSLEQLQISLSGNANDQKLQGQARGNFGQISLTAAGPLITQLKGDLKIEAKDFQPARLGLEKPQETALGGKFTGAFSLPPSGDLSGLRLTGDLEARGRLNSQPLEDLRARLSWQQPKLEVSKASLRLGPLAAEFSGSVDGERPNCQFRGSLASGATKTYLPAADCGPLAFSGTLGGALTAPRFVLQGTGQDLRIDGISLKSFSFQTNGAAWPPAMGNLEIQGAGLTTPAGAFPQAHLSCRGEENLWQLHFTAGGREGLKAEAAGTADLRARPISLVLPKFSWHSKDYAVVNTSPVQLRLIPGLQLATAAFKVNGGDLTLKVEAQGAHLAGLLSLKNFPADLFQLRGRSSKGMIDGQFSIAGEPAAPLLQGQLHWGKGMLGNFRFQTLQARVDYHGGFLYLTGSLDEKAPGPRLVWDGQIPLNFSLIPLKWSLGSQNMALNVKGERTSLAMLTAFGPGVQTAQGSLDISAQLRGDPHEPQVSGQIRWGEGAIKFRATGLNYHLLPGEARLQGNKISILNLVLQSGGTFRLSGDLALQGLTQSHLNLRGQAVNFLALSKEGSQVETNANLALTGPLNAALLTGQISITKGTLATSFFQSGSHPDIILVNKPAIAPGSESAGNLEFWDELRADLTLQSAGEVWVKNKAINVDMQGSLKVLKAPGQDKMLITGVARAVKGTIEIQGRTFKVSEGTVTLHGKPGVQATLAGQAVAEVDPITLLLDISGPAGKPLLRFTSNPPLPPPDLLAYLVFGRPAATLSKEEYASVTQHAIGIVGGISAGKLKEILGPGFPLISDVSLKSGEQTLGVTKPLTKQLSVSFERKTNPLYRDDTNQVKLEYKINKYMGVESTMGRHNSGGDVLLNYDF